MSTRAATTTRLAGLDGLRGVACLMVFLYHLRWHARPGDGALALPLAGFDIEPLLTRFDSGVAIFFVLSGLLLSLPFWRSILSDSPMPPAGPFLWRRLRRIAPAYYAVLVVVYLLRGGTYTFYGMLDFLLHATFLHNFTDYSYHSVLGVLWTIGIELQFYLLLPIIMAALAAAWRKGGTWLAMTALIAGTWVIGLTADALARSLAPLVADRFMADNGAVVQIGTVFSFLRLFAFGIAAGLLTQRWQSGARAADFTCGAALAGIVVLLAFSTEGAWHEAGWFSWPLNALAIALFAAVLPHSGIFRRILGARPLAAAGLISYGIYLWHEMILRAAFDGTLPHRLEGWPLFLAGGALALGMTCLIATLSWRHIEQPALAAPCPFLR